MQKVQKVLTRYVYTAEEKIVKKSWSPRSWRTILANDQLGNPSIILTAKWSGYSGQSNCNTSSLMHASLAPSSLSHPYYSEIPFDDGSFLYVNTEKVFMEELLGRRISQNLGYEGLINAKISKESKIK